MGSASLLLTLGVLMSVVTFVVMSQVASQNLLLVWLVVQISLTVYRMRWLTLERERITGTDVLPVIPLRSYTVMSFISGCVWASLVLFFHADHPLNYQIFGFVALVGVAVASVFVYAPFPLIQLAFGLPILTALAVWCFIQSASIHFWGGALAVSFILIQLVFVAANWRVLLRSASALADREQQLSVIQDENSTLHERMESGLSSEKELKRDRLLFMDGPVVRYCCKASEGEPIERISENVSQFGHQASDLYQGQSFFDLIHEGDRARVAAERAEMLNGSSGASKCEYRLRRADNSYCWVFDYTRPVCDSDGKVTHVDGYLLDIDRLYEANEALAKEKERAQVTLESIGDAVITTTSQGRIDFMNSVAEKLTGWSFSLARYSPLAEVFRIRQGSARWVEDPVQLFLDSGDLSDGRQKEAELHSRQGDRTLITYNAAPIRGRDDRLLGYVLAFLDVTDKKDLQRELEFQARHDSLTGLINRREFERRLTALIGSAHDEGREHVLLYMDLDQFKLINDTCGHVAGDELLIQLTHNLQRYLRPEDTFARLGGDEFGVLLEDCGLDRGQDIAQIIRAAVRQYQFSWEGRVYEVGASIGLVAIDKDTVGIGQILSAADVACYSAKESGRNRVCVYQNTNQDLLRREVEMDWATRIAKSMEEGLLVLYYQEIVPVTPPALELLPCRHIEVLLRVRDSGGRIVEPEAFLSSAERYNLMPDLDRWVLRHSLEWFSKHQFGDSVQMSINLSGLTLSDAEFAPTVKRLLREFQVPASSVCFEITETAAIASLETAADFMRELSGLGCKFSLDDFGSGLSSFAYLKALPVDYLKIDGNFVRNILASSVDRAMVGAINDIGHTLQLKTVAEYVNDIKILRELELLGVDYAQGYALSRPRKLREFGEVMQPLAIVERVQTLSLH